MSGMKKPTRSSTATARPTVPLAFRAHRQGMGEPAVARVHHRDDGYHDAESAAAVVCSACAALPASVRLVLAGGAFGWVELETPTASRIPTANEFAACLRAGDRWLSAFVGAAMPATVDAVFGLDAYATTTRGGGARPVAQFVVHIEAGGSARIVAAKRFPTDKEARFLYLGANSHGLPVLATTALGRTLALSCHEGTVFSPRGISRTSDGEWRSMKRDEVRADIGTADALVNVIHSLPSERTFAMSYELARKERAHLTILGVFGSKPDVTADDAVRMARCLTVPSNLPTVELIPADW